MIVAGPAGHGHGQQVELRCHSVLDRQSRCAEGGQCTGGSAEHRDKDARLGVFQSLNVPAQLIDPRADLVAEGRRHGVLTVCAAGAGIVGVLDGQRRKRAQHLTDLTKDDLVSLAQLQNVAGLRDVLGRRPPMDITAHFAAQNAVQFPDQWHERMSGDRQPCFDVLDAEQIELAMLRDLDGGIRRDHAEFGFSPSESGLNVEPGLPAGFPREQRPDARIGHTGGGWSILHLALLHGPCVVISSDK